MSDVVDPLDLSAEREEIARASAIKRTGQDIPAGTPGECGWCGEQRPRLIKGACARCRDEYGLG